MKWVGRKEAGSLRRRIGSVKLQLDVLFKIAMEGRHSHSGQTSGEKLFRLPDSLIEFPLT